ncbi:hypothetical protein [Sphaerisporangium perillae]|uniref:hypothetical protein n=1 Tax=Sphaerisporangium perillae TaxID=2935860 RepID=UPI00200C53E4|nr:hypothetical protein [Sphaerisporangium perillae]
MLIDSGFHDGASRQPPETARSTGQIGNLPTSDPSRSTPGRAAARRPKATRASATIAASASRNGVPAVDYLAGRGGDVPR